MEAKLLKNMFLYEITHRDLKNDYQVFDTLKTKDHKIRGNCNLLIKVKFYKLEWSSPLISLQPFCLYEEEFFDLIANC